MDSVAPIAPPEFAADEGALVGRVINDEQLPLANATIRLVGGGRPSAALLMVASSLSQPAETRSASDGRFQFNHLEPGTYSVIALADGHQPAARGAEIRAGEVTSVILTLTPIPPPYVPYMKQGPVWNGYLGCSVGFYSISSLDVCGNVDSKVNSSTRLALGSHLNAIHWEMKWQSSSALSARYLSLLFTSAVIFNCAHAGPSPIVKNCELGANATSNSLWEKNNTEASPQVRAKGNNTTPNSNTLGTWINEHSGPVVQQRFTVYWTFFHGGMPIPPGFRNSPDA